MRGLAYSLPANVEFYEELPITDIDYGPPHRLRTPDGEIATPKLILATNGFTDGWGFLERHLIRLVTYASITRPLTDKQLAVMGNDANWGVTCTIRMGSTVRRTADNRLMMRNCFRYGGDTGMSDGELAHARRNHIDALKARFPQLGEPQIEHTWVELSASLATLPPIGESWRRACWPRSAATASAYPRAPLPAAIAEYALGHDSELVRDLATFPKAANHGLGPFIGLATSLRLRLQQMQAGAEH